MSQRRIWFVAGLAVAAALAGSAFAQTGAGSGTSGAMPPDTTVPNEPAQRASPSDGTTGGSDADAANSSGKSATTPHKKHSKKKAKTPQTPKPADNDNNAMPNTVSPSPTSAPQ